MTVQYVRDKSNSILNKIESLAQQANQLRTAANRLYSSVAGMSLGQLPDMHINVAFSNYNTLVASLPPIPNVVIPTIANGAIGTLPSLSLDTFDKSTIPAPQLHNLTSPTAPNLSRATAPPAALNLSGMPAIPDAPTINVSVGSLPSLDDFSLQRLDPVNIDWNELEPIPNVPNLSARVDLGIVRAALLRKFVPDTYTYKLLPDALVVCDDVLSGGLGFSFEDANTSADANLTNSLNRFSSRVNDVWTRRGFDSVASSARASYVGNVFSRVRSEMSAHNAALRARLRMRNLPKIFQVVIAGHATLAEIERQFYELDFAFLATELELQTQFVSVMADALRARLSEFKLLSAQYAGVIAQIKANVEAHLAAVRVEQAKSQVNAAYADAYAAEQSSHAAKVRAFEAHYQAALAVVEAYNTAMQSLQAKAKAANAALLRFKADSDSWGAQFLAAKAEFDLRAAENRSIVAQNQLAASQVGVSAISAEAVASAAQAAATDVAASAAMLKSQLAQRLSQYMQIEGQNMNESLRSRFAAATNEYRALKFGADTLPLSAEYANVSDVNSAVTSTMESIRSLAMSTSRTVQGLRSQLVDAYIGLYRALADAEAARVTGEASKVRADVRITARGDSEATWRDVWTGSDTLSKSNVYSDEKVTLYRPLRY